VNATTGNFQTVTAANGNITVLNTQTGNITTINAVTGNVTTLNAGTVNVTGNVTAGGTITAGSGMVANGRVQNVSPGILPTDAANMSQLNQVRSEVQDMRKTSSTGAAIALAAASVPALEAGKQFGVGVGVGSYDGRSAIAAAVSFRINESAQIKLNVGTGQSGKVGGGIGASWSW
jgi:autotransporter adhesin